MKRRADELGGGDQFTLSIASRNLVNEMSVIRSVQLAMRDPTGPAERDISDSVRMELIVNEVQMMESIAVSDDDHNDDQQLVFREMIVGGSQFIGSQMIDHQNSAVPVHFCRKMNNISISWW